MQVVITSYSSHRNHFALEWAVSEQSALSFDFSAPFLRDAFRAYRALCIFPVVERGNRGASFLGAHVSVIRCVGVETWARRVHRVTSELWCQQQSDEKCSPKRKI